jgi:O-antigen/teichoic acid export membrane protein
MKPSEISVADDPFGNVGVSLTGRLFARNAALNLAGEIGSFVVGGLCIPFVVKRLGTDSFGILSLAWTLLSYISLFDLGLSRATTKFVAESMSTGKREQIPSLVWTSISLQVVLGILGFGVLAGTSHILVERIFKVLPQLTREAESGFFYLAWAVPIVLISNCLRGVLEAVQRFDLTNGIKIPVNVLMFATPLF